MRDGPNAAQADGSRSPPYRPVQTRPDGPGVSPGGCLPEGDSRSLPEAFPGTNRALFAAQSCRLPRLLADGGDLAELDTPARSIQGSQRTIRRTREYGAG